MMETLLRGAPVRDAIDGEIKLRVKELKAEGCDPMVATFRIGDDDGEQYYEKAVIKRASEYGFDCKVVVLPEDVSQEEAEAELRALNEDARIHGILMLMPFPKSIDSDALTSLLSPEKDIDAITDASYSNLFTNKKDGFFACTAESCMEILRHYDVDLKGKHVVIVGRSLRVGKPLLMMMLNANATVTVCHSRTKEGDLRRALYNADIVVLATGLTEYYGPEFFRDGQIIIDVGTGRGKDGKMAGDFDSKSWEQDKDPEHLCYTPVPGGVGTVTTTLLLRNVVKAAERKQRNQ